MRMNIWDWFVLISVIAIACSLCYMLGIEQGEADMFAAFEEFGCYLEPVR